MRTGESNYAKSERTCVYVAQLIFSSDPYQRGVCVSKGSKV